MVEPLNCEICESFVARGKFNASTRLGFDINGGAVTKHFGDALCDFGGVVADADDGVCAERACVSEHEIEGVLARAFAKVGVKRNVTAENSLNACAEVADD